MNRRRKIITNNRELYEKFNMLNFSNEVLLKEVKPIQINRIFSNINKDSNILKFEKIGTYFLIKKLKPLNFDIYYKNKSIK